MVCISDKIITVFGFSRNSLEKNNTIISRQERLACVLSTGTDISIYYDPLKPKGGSRILKWG